MVESIYDYADFLKKHLPNYEELKLEIEQKYPGVINYCVTKNQKSKISFEFEWGMLDASKKDKIFHQNISKLEDVITNEVDEPSIFFDNKNIIDIGCGHGIITSQIARMCKNAIGVELSKAIEDAYKHNVESNAWYVQADLQFLPFGKYSFDVIYTSGVLHHTNNTELSLSLVEETLKPGGKISVWLYHPQKDFIHNSILALRNITKQLPFYVALTFITILIFPFTYLFKKIKAKESVNYREEIIDLLDTFTPEFRYETNHDEAQLWLIKREYEKVKIATNDQFGFAVVGFKKAR